MALVTRAIPIPTTWGATGAPVDVSDLTGEKTILLSNSFEGTYVLLGSHDGSYYVPVATFSGHGDLPFKELLGQTYRYLALRSLGTMPSGMSAAVCANQDATVCRFLALPTVPAGAYGPQAVVDLFDLLPPAGVSTNTCVILSGAFVGQVSVEGSLDRSAWSSVATWSCPQVALPASGLLPSVPEWGPAPFEAQVRYLRVNVLVGSVVTSALHVSLGGQVPGSASGEYIPTSEKGAANGVAVLDGDSKVPIVEIPVGTTSGTVATGNDARIVGAIQSTEKGAANGVAELDANSLIPIAEIPVGQTTGTVAAGDDPRITGAIQSTEKGAANGVAELDANSMVPIAEIPVGTTTGTVAAGDDPRITSSLSMVGARVWHVGSGAGMYASIQLAVDAINTSPTPPSSTNRCVVLVWPGWYTMSTPVVVPSYVTIKGIDRRNTILENATTEMFTVGGDHVGFVEFGVNGSSDEFLPVIQGNDKSNVYLYNLDLMGDDNRQRLLRQVGNNWTECWIRNCVVVTTRTQDWSVYLGTNDTTVRTLNAYVEYCKHINSYSNPTGGGLLNVRGLRTVRCNSLYVVGQGVNHIGLNIDRSGQSSGTAEMIISNSYVEGGVAVRGEANTNYTLTNTDAVGATTAGSRVLRNSSVV